MADINFNFKSDDLEELKKLLNDIATQIKKLQKGEIIGQDEAVRAKKLAAEALKVENAMKRQEIASKGIADRQERINQKQKESKGIIGGLERDVKNLRSALKSATNPKDIAKLNGQLKETRKRLSDAKGTTASWSKALGSFQFKFNALGNIAANVTQKISQGFKDLIRDALRMSLEFEGVNNAFQKMNDPKLLSNLQKATRGTVNNLELMKSAVNAKNFKIPMEQFSSFLEFATNRAIETGEEVDYLVESIVKGLGRKSVLILDNLGLSVSEINEEFKRTGDFMVAAANIIEREMEASGTVLDTNLIKVKQQQAEWDNLKITLGTAAQKGILFLADRLKYDLNPALLGTGRALRRTIEEMDEFSLAVNNFRGFTVARIIGDENEIKDRLRVFLDTEEEVNKFYDALLSEAESAADRRLKNLGKANDEQITSLKSLREELKLHQDIRERLSIDDTEEILLIDQKIAAIEKQIQAIDDLSKKQEELRNRPDVATVGGIDDAGVFETFQTDMVDEETKRRKEIREQEEKDIRERNQKIKDNYRDRFAEEQRAAEEAEELKRALVAETFAIASDLTSSLASIYESNKQRELSAAGDNAEKRAEIEAKYAEKQKRIAIAQAIINAAQGALKTYYQFGFPLAIPFMAAGAAVAGIQIAAIKKQKFAEGGEVGGKLHAHGGTDIEAEKGEYVINRRSTSKYKNLIEGINEDNHLKILMSLDKDRSIRSPRPDPWTRRMGPQGIAGLRDPR